MTCVDVTTFKKTAAVLQLKKKKLHFSDLNPKNQNYFIWVFIRMCTIVTSSDMTSFVYIGDEKHHLSKWLGKEKKWPQQKEIVLSLLSDWRNQRRIGKKCWINQATVSKFKKQFYCGARLKTCGRKTSTGARGDKIILRTEELNRSQQTVDRHDYC